MARKFYTKKSKKVKEEALAQLRKTRAEFDEAHPEMLDDLKAKIEAAGGPENLQFKEPPQKSQKAPAIKPPKREPVKDKKAGFAQILQQQAKAAPLPQETSPPKAAPGPKAAPVLKAAPSKAAPSKAASASKAPPRVPEANIPAPKEPEALIPIDRTKNLETVLEFLKLTDSPTVRSRLKDIVVDSMKN